MRFNAGETGGVDASVRVSGIIFCSFQSQENIGVDPVPERNLNCIYCGVMPPLTSDSVYGWKDYYAEAEKPQGVFYRYIYGIYHTICAGNHL
jgi:hypothetical protein